MWFAIGFTVFVYFWVLCDQGILLLYVLLFFWRILFKHIGCSFECFHTVDSRWAWTGNIHVWTVSSHTDFTFLRCSTSGITWGCASGVSVFSSSIFIFGNFSFLGVTVKFLLLIGRKMEFFAGFTGWISSIYAYTIGTIRGSALVDGVAWDEIFIWDLSWFTSLGFSWNIYLIGTLRVISGGLDLLNISAKVINAYLGSFNFVDSGLAGSIFYSA